MVEQHTSGTDTPEFMLTAVHQYLKHMQDDLTDLLIDLEPFVLCPDCAKQAEIDRLEKHYGEI